MKMNSFSCSSFAYFRLSIAFGIFISVISSQASTVIVDSPVGKIRGLRKTDNVTGQSFISFKGIPYAKPPVGQLRFAKPQPIQKFDGTFDGTRDEGITCPNLGMPNPREDCLILHIHLKDFVQGSELLKKVLVFIHGGAFIIGNANIYDPTSFVISQDVIVVTINYRLGILGFLSTENEASPGNYGLWDQTLALKWVKDNIRAFGGDPDDITIAGESAGGASVGYQTITPHTKGLFTRAYLQSGTATSVFAKSIDTLSLTLRAAKYLKCWNKDTDAQITLAESSQIVQCLRQLPVSTVMSFFQYTLTKTNFVPTLDGDFIPDYPSNLLRKDDYLESIGFFNRTYLIGTNNYDAGYVYTAIGYEKAPIINDNNTSPENELKWKKWLSSARQLHLESRLGEKDSKNQTILDSIETFYARRYKDELTCLAELATDLNFLVPSLDYLSAASRRPSCSVYHLYFDYFPEFMEGSGHRGTFHAADLLYWFDTLPFMVLGFQATLSEEDLRLKEKFSTIIGQFVKTGEPGHCLENCWPQYDSENSYYLRFNSRPWVSNFLKKDRQVFWMETIPKLVSEMQHDNKGL